jgi:hypothetical protein
MLRACLRHLHKHLFADRNYSRPAARKPSRVRLGVESLEARELLTIAPPAQILPPGGGGTNPPAQHIYMDDLSTLSVTQGDVNQPYAGTITVGSPGEWLQPISGLPAGLSATQSSSGTTITLSGTPAQTGTFAFDVNLSVLSRIANVTYSDGRAYSLTINPALKLGSLSAAPWTAGQVGSAAVAVSGGTPAYSNLAATGLPPGLTAALSANAITFSGTPTQAGTFNNVAVSLQDGTGATVRQTYSLTVNLGLSSLTSSAVTAGQQYAASVNVTGGGSGHYNYTVLSGSSLPTGLVFSNSGGAAQLSGSPTVAGTYDFLIQATDATNTAVTGTQAYTLTVNPAAASRLIFPAQPASIVAGTELYPDVQAVDPYGNGVSGIRITLGSTTLPTLLGDAVFAVEEDIAGTYTLTASAPGLGSVTSNAFTVTPALATTLVVSPSTTAATAGSGFTVTITAKDQYGNTVDRSGGVTLSSSDGQLAPTSATFIHGIAKANITLDVAATVTLSAASGALQGTSSSLTVSPAAASRFVVAPSTTSTTAGIPFTVTVTAKDAFGPGGMGNTVTTYKGAVTLSSSDSPTMTPVTFLTTNGIATVRVTLDIPASNFASGTADNVTLTASAIGALGSSNSISITPPAITGMSTTFGYAQGYSAQYLQAGSSVTIYGAGFQTGARVQFGNTAIDSNLLVTPTSIDPSGTSLTVTVPMFAATGKLLVQLPSGSVLSSPNGVVLTSTQSFTVHNFRNTYGFSFGNDGPFIFNITEGLIDSEYGSPISAGDVIVGGILGGPFGAGAAAAADAAFATAYLEFCKAELDGKGSCYGFDLASIAMMQNPSLINAANGLPSNLPSGHVPTAFDLQNNANLTQMIQKDLLVQFSAEQAHYAAVWAADSATGAHSAQSIHDQIASLLQAGQHPILGMQGGANHALLAYNLEPDTDPNHPGAYFIDTYDCDRPYNDNDGEQALASRVHIDPATGWSFTLQGSSSVSGGGFNDLSFMVTPPSVVSGNVTKPTSLTGLATIAVGAATPAPAASQQAGALNAYFATQGARVFPAFARMPAGEPVYSGLAHAAPETPHGDATHDPAAVDLKRAQPFGATAERTRDLAFAGLGDLDVGREDPFALFRSSL